MCCRYYMEMSPELRPIVEAAERSKLYLDHRSVLEKPLITEGEVFPDMLVPVIAANRAGKKTVFPMIWGYREEGIRRLLVNARSETAAEKRSFREGWAMHRCIIPASWYFEWEHRTEPDGRKRTGAKHAIKPRGGGLTRICGLYRMENGYPHFVILTREAGEAISFLHDRMPLILPEGTADRWIDPNQNPQELLSGVLTDLIAEKTG